jgi:hypothetical protein
MKSNVIDNLSLVLQALSLQILFQDYNNSDLMSELRQQDETYLKTIINQNNEILDILGKENNRGKGNS